MLNYIYIRMANNEYDTNCDMRKLAEEQFALHPEVENLIVEVYEHGGWWLGFAKDDGQIIIVSTANDMATVNPARRRFWDRCRHMPPKVVANINREPVAA